MEGNNLQGSKGVEGIKERAQFFKDNNLRAFLVDKYNNYHFCFIKQISDAVITIRDFVGKRANEDNDLLLIDIKSISLYKEKRQ